jgi:hypothetical protein
MLDLLRVPKHEHGSLTGVLTDLRQRISSATAARAINSPEQEVVRALEQAEARETRSSETSVDESPIEKWNEEALRRVLGFTPSSPQGGFGRSSRSA